MPRRLLSRTMSIDEYNLVASLNPDAHHIIPSCAGRMPLPLRAVRMSVQAKVSLASGQAAAFAFPAVYTAIGDLFTPIAASCVTGAVGSDQSATVPTDFTFPMKISSVVPTQSVASTSFPQFFYGCGTVLVDVIKEPLAADPSFIWTGAGSCRGSVQSDINDVALSATYAHESVAKLQSPLGDMIFTSLGNELPRARDRGVYFYGNLPPFVDRWGRQMPGRLAEPTVPGNNWSKRFTGGAYNGIETPCLSITNSATSSISVLITISRNFFVVPTEQYLASTMSELVKETDQKINPQILLNASIGAAGNTIDDAHTKALRSLHILHALRSSYTARSIDVSWNMIGKSARGESALPPDPPKPVDGTNEVPHSFVSGDDVEDQSMLNKIYQATRNYLSGAISQQDARKMISRAVSMLSQYALNSASARTILGGAQQANLVGWHPDGGRVFHPI